MDKDINKKEQLHTFLEQLFPILELTPESVDDVLKLPRFIEKLAQCESYFGTSFDAIEYELQQEILLARLRQIVNILQLNPLWKERFEKYGVKESIESFEDWQKIPITNKHTATKFFSEDRPGMVVPLDHGGFEIVASGGTSTGKPSETVYSLEELDDTYVLGGKFIDNHLLNRFFPERKLPPLVATTYADYQLWSSGTMVGGVLQRIPNTNYIAAGPIDKKVYHLMMSYEGPKVILGYIESINQLYDNGLELDDEAKESLRLALYCSGLLSKKKQKELKQLYPNLDILSYFSATQAEAIAIQLKADNDALTTVPGLHFVEIVDEEGKWVEEGQEGELIITRLHCNKAPLVRYKLGDRAIRLPIRDEENLKAFQFEFRGRSGDIIHLEDHQFSALNTYDYLKEQLATYSGVILDDVASHVQIVHRRAEKLLSFIIATDFASRCEHAVYHTLGDAGIQNLIRDSLLSSMGLYSKSSIEQHTLQEIGYRFKLKFVHTYSEEIYRTELGKIPFFRDILDSETH
jgi:phenylacetate-CoA ligase